MNEEVLGHREFWAQFRQYLDEHKIQIRLSGSSKSSLSEVFLPRSYFRLKPWHLLKDSRLGVSVQFNEPDAMARYQLAQQHRQTIDDRLTGLGALDWQPGKISLSRSAPPSQAETWQQRNAWLANAIQVTGALFNEIFPPSTPLNLKFQGEKVVNVDTGEEYDILAVAARLPWQAQGKKKSSWKDYPPYMPPHEYILLGKCNYTDWDVLYFACTKHPASYRAYFRGYQSPMRYLEAGDGYRYWFTKLRGALMLNRCTLDRSTSPTRPRPQADQARGLGRAALVAPGKRLAAGLPEVTLNLSEATGTRGSYAKEITCGCKIKGVKIAHHDSYPADAFSSEGIIQRSAAVATNQELKTKALLKTIMANKALAELKRAEDLIPNPGVLINAIPNRRLRDDRRLSGITCAIKADGRPEDMFAERTYPWDMSKN